MCFWGSVVGWEKHQTPPHPITQPACPRLHYIAANRSNVVRSLVGLHGQHNFGFRAVSPCLTWIYQAMKWNASSPLGNYPEITSIPNFSSIFKCEMKPASSWFWFSRLIPSKIGKNCCEMWNAHLSWILDTDPNSKLCWPHSCFCYNLRSSLLRQ